MPRILQAVLVCFGALASSALPAAAQNYPFCIQGNEYPGLSNCTFTSYEQCQASASGRFLTCVQNPFFNPEGDYAPRGTRGPRVRSVYPTY